MFKIDTSLLKKDGILYLLEIELEDKVLVKIGVTTRDKVENRVCEILTSIWKSYRIFPKTYVKRFRKTSNVYDKETKLHQIFEEYRYSTEHRFSGSTEIFDVEISKVVEEYEKLLAEDN